MIERLRRRLTYANVMATLAMFAALGGGAYAAATIGAGDIKKNAVRSKHIKTNVVKGRDVAEDTLVIGAQALGTIRERSATDPDIAAGDSGQAGVQCHANEQFLSGGSDYSGTDVSIAATRFEPPNGWRVFLDNEAGSGEASLTAHVYCLAP
jgi:hypothetical protein